MSTQPQIVALEADLKKALEAVREDAAAKFLDSYRQLLAPHRIANHQVVVRTAMGLATVEVIPPDWSKREDSL
ncbi:hypothetical protein ACQKEM_15040 [Pseudomonas sp. NPDC077382]